MVYIEQLNKGMKKRDSKWGVVCPDCGHERVVSYCQAYNIRKEINTGRCPKCTPRKSSSAFKKGSIPWNKGIAYKPGRSYEKNKAQMEIVNTFGQIVSKETRLKMSEAKKAAHEENPSVNKKLKNDPRNSKRYDDWRDAVLTRDSHTCQHCKQPNKKVVAHHIEKFNYTLDLNYSIDNGQTLCTSCHAKEHYSRGDLGVYKQEVLNVI